MRQKLLFIIYIISFSCFSQTGKTYFTGKVIDSTEVIKNAHIINLKTTKGTFSNDFGIFKILAQQNDSLQITCIGYKPKTIHVGSNFREKENFIFLEKEVYNLDEIIIKNHNLTRSLSLDLKKIPIDKKAMLVDKIISDIKKIDYNAIANMPVNSNEMHLAKPATVTLPNTFKGVGIRSGGGSVKKTKSLAQMLEEKQQILGEIYKLIGENYFFKELKIPKEKHLHFLTFCSYKGIIELYKKNEILELIKIIRQESVLYLKL